MDAFIAAGEIAKLKPKLGTDEWEKWHNLCAAACAANEAYLAELKRSREEQPSQ
jgi:hypothetical protein